jgi:hypothetical protein
LVKIAATPVVSGKVTVIPVMDEPVFSQAVLSFTSPPPACYRRGDIACQVRVRYGYGEGSHGPLIGYRGQGSFPGGEGIIRLGVYRL